MAHLDIQEKKGNGWLWWLIGLIVLALLAWWLLASDTDDLDTADVPVTPAAVAGDPAATAPTAGTSGDITSLDGLTGTTDAASLMGRRVALTGVPVSSAVSDKGFWIGSGTGVGSGIFAVRTNQMQPNTADDGAVSAGRNVNVWGVVTAMPTNLGSQTATWNLAATDTQALGAHRFYIHVDSVRIAN